MQSRDQHGFVRPRAARGRVSRRALLAGLSAITALEAVSATAQVDRRNAQATWNLQRVSPTDTSGVILVRIFRGYFPLPDHLVLDGRPIKTLGHMHTAIVGGDGKCYSVACASILAKVARDRLIRWQ